MKVMLLLKAYAHSLIVVGLKVLAYLPSHALRIAGLRAAGADLGHDILIYHGFWAWYPWRLSIGNHTVVGDHVILDARGGLQIGESVNISSEVAIWTGQHDMQSPDFAYVKDAVKIGNHAWLSFRSVILPGVSVGEGAVIAAGAVVTKDVPPYTVMAGIPAKPIGVRNQDLRYDLGRGDGSFLRFV